ncbi:uncharacterized protein B0I36DRAFT_356925 [Microdochium trichocladiopsis]|uniref:Uncharacterized protein n=1 Tax=Microdochium trichocladiopsis TaxID=1682393 RepID=A0A9P8XQT3_9PEZI|nr:uncharacterized protein B0I36DRAFT_356925 [Microdochium trichocladiopsis]KAH7007895.1 hypothetical protein B0I36DRAFT_356925 [Microdochium trichocladiopsis]
MAQRAAEDSSKGSSDKTGPSKVQHSITLDRKEIDDICKSWLGLLGCEMVSAWGVVSDSDRFTQWADHSHRLFAGITEDLRTLRITRAQCSCTLALITFYIVILCGVIPRVAVPRPSYVANTASRAIWGLRTWSRTCPLGFVFVGSAGGLA